MFNTNSKFQVCVNTEILQGYEILFIKKILSISSVVFLAVHAELQFKIICGTDDLSYFMHVLSISSGNFSFYNNTCYYANYLIIQSV